MYKVSYFEMFYGRWYILAFYDYVVLITKPLVLIR